MKYSLGISNFLEEISSLSNSIVFLYFFVLITEERLSYLSLLFFGTLHSNGNVFPFLLCFSLLFFSQLVVRPPQTAILVFCISFQVAHSKWAVSSDCCCNWDFPDSSVVKNLPAMQETQEMWVRSLGQENPPEEEMATHFSILAWKIPWTEEPGRLQSLGLQRGRYD